MASVIHLTVVLCILGKLWNQASCDLDVCSQPAVTGLCEAFIPQWFFNITSMQCEEFTYGGCGGNDNRFDTEKECIAMCMCYLGKEVGPCEAAMKRWFYNKMTKHCEMFIYRGCEGNANNFETEEECKGFCDVCSLPSETGPCRAYFQRWFYNKNTKKCESFIYGGCKGNANNFMSDLECKEACDPCYMPKEKGHCKAKLKRYFYDHVKNKCKKFYYEGCGGNANNYKKKKKCKKACQKK